MSRYVQRLRQWAFFHPAWKWLLVPLAIFAIVGVVYSGSTPAANPLINLATEPLYARGLRAKPTLTLALSVEFPTVGAQYLNTPGATYDDTYTATTQYVGYFDSESCYTYNDVPTEGMPTADYKRFDRSKAATSRTCGGDSFSGNFMNWAMSSAIDILRYGLTGGDRVVDTAGLTVLQRAVLPNSTVSSNFWNGSNFPDKRITATAAASVLPTSLINSYTGTIHIANCLNRIHFGTAATGNCASPGANSALGVSPSSGIGPITTWSGPLPSGFTSCASENGTCSFSGIKQVAYGAGNNWYFASAANGVSCSNTVFGDPAVGTAKACYTRTDPTGWGTTSSAGALTSDNFFYTRVSVCAKDSSGNLLDPRISLCLRYPNGNYKPVGNLQKYSDRLRVAAFGYLNDPTGNPNERYGGVLRAPMKYVGPTAYDANYLLVSGTNPNQEWDSNSGIFLANPDSNTTINSGPTGTGPMLSGVTNYLNQFGRTGTFGQYKTYDPVGELYYESLRYIQGLPMTPQATVGMTAAMQDGYPVTTSWVDPHPPVSGMTDYSCVKNNILAIGDANTHNDKSFPGNLTRMTNENSSTVGFTSPRLADVTRNEPDFYTWTKVVGAFESNHTEVTYLDAKGVSRNVSNFNPPNTARWGMEDQNIGADGAAYFIAGAAYWGNTHDIRGSDWTANWPTTTDPRRPGMRVTTYILDVNENASQNNPTTRHNNQFFLASKYGGFTDASGIGNPYLSSSGGNTNAPWQDAANPGEAKNYFLSSSATAVLAALDQIFANIVASSNSIAGGAVSTQRLSSVPGFVYQAQFDASSWSGDLSAYAVGTDTSGSATIASTSSWSGAKELDAKAKSTTLGGDARNIVIGKTAASSSYAGTDFRWSSVDADVQAALKLPPYAAASAPADPDSTGQARLNFLRGDRSNEAPGGLLMRTRTSVLGDIVNSPVVFMGAPVTGIADTDYAAFLTTNASRKHALFVGANDGMLHAFDPDAGFIPGDTGGNELFAYIPSWMIPKLGALTSPSYVHQAYVDGNQAVAEAKVGTGSASGTWKTVLVGGTGAGGQGVYALDVTNPAAFDASKVMWEFTDKDDADMGNVIGRPQILKIRTSAASAAADYQYFAVVASGVDNNANDGFASTTGSPAIFILDLNKAKGTPWTLGTNYFKVSFPVISTAASGMVGFTARVGSDGALTSLYAGDIQGNLWKLDFTQAITAKSVTAWSLATLSYYKDSSGNPMPMYVAKDASGNRQPITMEPSLLFGPARTIIVTFGTGKFLEVSDNTTTGSPQQSVYAIVDENTTTADSGTSSTAAIAGRSRLVAATFSGSTITVPSFTWGRSLSDTDTTGLRSGWYADFAQAGERQVSDFAILAGSIVFGSVIPAINSCDSGSGNLYVVNIFTGAGTVTTSPVGILGQPLVVQVGLSTTTSTDATGSRRQATKSQIILIGSGGKTTTGTSMLDAPTVYGYAGRLSWREITNYQLMRQTP